MNRTLQMIYKLRKYSLKKISSHKILKIFLMLPSAFFLMGSKTTLQQTQDYVVTIKKHVVPPYASDKMSNALAEIGTAMQPEQLTVNRDPFSEKVFNEPSSKTIKQQNSQYMPEHAELLQTQLIPIHYIKAGDLEKLFSNKALGVLSNDGSVVAVDSYQLFIRDYKQNLNNAEQLIKKLDIARPQIVINTRIVTVDNQCVRNLGVLYGFHNESAEGSQSENALLPTIAAETIAIPILKFKDSGLLMTQITALEKNGHAQLISNPEILTLNHDAAVIESGEEVPYQESTASGATSVAFKKAVLRLKVTPEIMPHNQILLHLVINQDKVSSLTVNGVPAIRTQELQTQVLINNHETVVLGGIMEQTDSDQQQGIPGLNKVPLMGALFRNKVHELNHRQLLIFVMPNILND